MRIVVVEDEVKTRNGVIHIINQFTAHEVVGVAENGAEGYELVKQLQPDLLISDIKMPIMDGLELLHRLHEEKIQVNTILLTGYSDFEYARTALKYQVLDYLLKPVDLEQFLQNLNEVEAQISDIQSSKVSIEQLLAEYIDGHTLGSKDEILLNERLHVNAKTEISLFLVVPRKIFAKYVKEYVECLKDLMQNLCIENAYVHQLLGEKQILVLVTDTEKNRTLKNRFLQKVLPELDEIGGCTCTYCRIYGLQNISEAIESLKKMLEMSFSLPEHVIIDQKMVDAVHYGDLEYPQNLEYLIVRELRNGHRERMPDYGERFISGIVDSNADPDKIKEYAIRFIVVVFRVAMEVTGSFDQEENIKYFVESILSSETKGEVRYQIEKFFRAIAQESKEGIMVENGIVMNAISYIREHYSEEIALPEVARVCRVTPEYLSKIFYNETGINFSHFVQNIRVNVAKQMLLNENCKVYEVAEAVGYKDQKYFIRIFKKLCGMTPSEYRKEFKV